MSEDASGSPERVAIGISFGNSNSSIAHIGVDGKPEVIANEEGGRWIEQAMQCEFEKFDSLQTAISRQFSRTLMERNSMAHRQSSN